MKIVITGGHLSPALALLPNLSKHTILFIGRKHAFEGDRALSFEYETVKKAGIPFKSIASSRLQRHLSIYTLPSLLKFPLGFFQGLVFLIRFKPDVVFSFGGYVALPVCIASFLLGVPIVTHEQTVKAGLSNRIISLLAKKICITFADSAQYFPASKTVLTGNPIRQELLNPPKKSPFDIANNDKKQTFPMIYITGGSGGSHSINMLILQSLSELLKKYIVIHQSGNAKTYNDYNVLSEKVKKLPNELRNCYILKEFVSAKELAWIYENIDLIIGRCGANTVHEILTFGIPALLIPLPWAADSEQEANARLVERLGLGKIFKQEELSKDIFLSAINAMIEHKRDFKMRKKLASQAVILNASEKVMAVLEKVVGNEKEKQRP